MAIHSYTWLYTAIHSYTQVYTAILTQLYIAVYSYIWLHIAISGYTKSYMAIHSYTWLYIVGVIKEARNSFFGLGVYLLKSKFRIEDKLRFP